MAICCPSCGSVRIVARNHARKLGGVAGAVAGTASGAAGAMSGAQTGAALGAKQVRLASPWVVWLERFWVAWLVVLPAVWPELEWVKRSTLGCSTTSSANAAA